MEGFSVSSVPPLRSPVVVMAFTGWSDTGQVTVDAAQQLIDGYDAEKFLEVDPEEYFVFTETRPEVSIDESGLRRLTWPTNEAYFARVPDGPHDIVVVRGTEPNLRWRTFSEQLSQVIAGLKPSMVCTLVARPAATPHTRPVPVSGSSADPDVAAKYGLSRSMYQGPTGILGVLHDTLRKYDVPLLSLAAGVPHYLNVEENPPASIALLQALQPMLGVMPPLDDLEDEREMFMERVDEASRSDEQIGEYVQTLEENLGAGESRRAPEPSGGDLPSADDILKDVEDFLRGGNDS